MKNLLTLLFALTTYYGYGQGLYHPNWEAGKTRTIAGYDIMLIEGKNNYMGNTNIAYYDLPYLLQSADKKAEQNMWTAEKKDELKAAYNSEAKGGMISLYIERPDIKYANTQNFTVIIQNEAGEELHRKEFDRTVPETPKGGNMWRNSAQVVLPEVFEMPFLVFVVDSRLSQKHKFKVSKAK